VRSLTIAITDEDIRPEQILLEMKRPEVGAIVSFLGTVKGVAEDGEVEAMTVESYEEMALQTMERLEREAREKFGVIDVALVHRVGRLKPTDNIVLIAVSSAHRQEAFDACRWLLEEVKMTAPLWKKEHTPGGDRWVEER